MTIARIAIQAPARNLVISTITSTTAVNVRPIALIDPRALHPAALGRVPLGLQVPGPVPDHAELAEVERDEDADDVELDQPGGLGVEGEDQHDRHHGQEHDAVAVGQPVAARAERARREPSWARIEPSTGKPLKAVLAASTRMTPVTVTTK